MKNYTPAFDSIFDKALLELTPAEFKVFYFVYRKTVGFNKVRDAISFNQIASGTNLSRRTATRVIKILVETMWIGKKKGNSVTPSTYHLGSVTLTLGGDNFTPQGSVRKAPRVVSERHPQETDLRNREERNNSLSIYSNNSIYKEAVKICGKREIVENFLQKLGEELAERSLEGMIEYIKNNDDIGMPGKYLLEMIRNKTIEYEELKDRFNER